MKTSLCSTLLLHLCFQPPNGLKLVTLLMLGTLISNRSLGQDQLSYNRDVRPILADKCFSCHGADSAARKADLRLDKRENALEMQAVVPGDIEASQLVARLVTEDQHEVMPPPEIKKPITAAETAILKQWIQEGAQYEAHWSLIKPQRPALPNVQNTLWVKTPIDHFVLSKIESMGLQPGKPADASTLLRRIYLDITGLPPEPAAVAQFVTEFENEGDTALARWIDRLLDSSGWGEHQARYWLDAARYADTHGLHFDNYREMWPYRDWVIRAFNSNQPFDQFTIEQLAGDLLPNPSVDQLIATGLQRCNITTNEGGTIAEENLANYASDRVQTLGWIYLGLTTNCAQCHDHKFDPMTMQDYYSLAAFFRNTTQGAFDGNVRDGKGPVVRVPLAEDLERKTALDQQITAAQQAREQHRSLASEPFEQWLAAVASGAGQPFVPTEDLLVHAPLIEGTGKDLLNLANNSALKTTGPINWTPEGKLGSAPELKPGSTIEIGEVGNFEIDQSFSFGAWVKTNTAKGTGAIIARMDQSQQHRGWDLWHENGVVAVHLIDSWPGSALKVATRSPVLKPGVWHHVFATYNGSGKAAGIKLFIDGQRVPATAVNKSLATGATVRTETPLRLGQRSQDQVFEGSIQEVRIYGQQLMSFEVQQLAKYVPLTALASKDRPLDEHKRNLLMNYFLENVDTQYSQLNQDVQRLEAERTEIENRSPMTHIQVEKMDAAPMANILMRGEYDKVGAEVPAAIPAALPPMPEGAPKNRLGLAQWIVNSENPLTARVTVNRFWQQLFGRGIVATPEDLGVSGAMPSHPELLDWLAVEFRENGWNIKRLFKELMLSATYRQSAATTTEKLEKDPENIWLTRGPRFRMDAEMVRDYALSVSGLLTTEMYGPPVKPYQPEGIWDVVGLPGGDTREYKQSQGKDLYRRSLYTFWKRMAPPPNMEVFNAPTREVCSVRRERTNTPLQALVTLNDPQFVEAARVLASRALSTSGKEDQTIVADRVMNWIGQQALCRPLTAREQSIVLASKEQYLSYYLAHPDDARLLLQVGEHPLDESLDIHQLAAWTMVANQLLNLDEVLNK